MHKQIVSKIETSEQSIVVQPRHMHDISKAKAEAMRGGRAMHTMQVMHTNTLQCPVRLVSYLNAYLVLTASNKIKEGKGATEWLSEVQDTITRRNKTTSSNTNNNHTLTVSDLTLTETTS